MVSVAEAKLVEGLTPEDFKDFFARWHEGPGKEANTSLNNVEYLEDVDGFKVCKLEVSAPWPIWNRVIIITFYPSFDREDGEQI